MFINLESGKIKLYELRTYKRLKDIQMKLIYSSPYEEFTKTECYSSMSWCTSSDPRVEKPYYIESIHSRYLGSEDSGDFYGTLIEKYETVFRKYALPDIYFVLDELEKQNYSYLSKFNQYILGNEVEKQQKVFDTYRRSILNNIKLVEHFSIEDNSFSKIYLELQKKSKGSLKKSLVKISDDIYSMDVASVPKLIKK